MPDICLTFQGRLTLSEAQAELDRQLSLLRAGGRAAQPKPVVVGDLSGLTEIDTSVLGVMLHLDREARNGFGVPIVWRGAPDNLLSLARLTSLMPVLQWESATA